MFGAYHEERGSRVFYTPRIYCRIEEGDEASNIKFVLMNEKYIMV